MKLLYLALAAGAAAKCRKNDQCGDGEFCNVEKECEACYYPGDIGTQNPACQRYVDACGYACDGSDYGGGDAKGADPAPPTGDVRDCGDGEFDIARLGALLETHKSLQQSLWPSIESPTIRAVYEALAPLSHGSFICGAGSGGHIIALLKSSATADAVTDAVRSCSSAPDARVVDVTLLL